MEYRPAMSLATCVSAGLTRSHCGDPVPAPAVRAPAWASRRGTMPSAGRAGPAGGAPRPPRCTRSGAPWSARRAVLRSTFASGGWGPCSPSRRSGLPQGRFEYRDPVQQVGDQPDGRVVEPESGAEPLDPTHERHLAGGEPQLAGRVAAGVEDAQGDETADQVRVRARGPGERLQVEAGRPDQDQCVGHYRLLGSKVETAASCSKIRRSSSVSLAGTMILTSAYRCPALPRGCGKI